MIKTFINQNKISLFVIALSFVIFGVLSFVSEPIAKPPEDVNALKNTTVPVAGQKMYDLHGSFTSLDYKDESIEYSLLFPASVIRETKMNGQETIFYYNGQRVAVLNFYYFPQKITTNNFATNVLGQKYVLAVDVSEKIFGGVPYITASSEKSYYRIASFKGGKWIGMIEMLAGNDTLEKQLLDTLKVK